MLLGRPGELECVAAPLKGDSDLVSGLCCKKRFKAMCSLNATVLFACLAEDKGLSRQCCCDLFCLQSAFPWLNLGTG